MSQWLQVNGVPSLVVEVEVDVSVIVADILLTAVLLLVDSVVDSDVLELVVEGEATQKAA